MIDSLLPRINAWFPLVPRPRPAAARLDERAAELQSLIRPESDVAASLTRAAEVFNKAALIASDCGDPDLAEALCWRQHSVFAGVSRLPRYAVDLALQPLLNIPRQMIRNGNGTAAFDTLAGLYRAARARSETTINGHRVSLGPITADPDSHKEVCTRIWTALLADGVRALATAGRWEEAAQHAAAHRGVGVRLLDGRQATILSLINTGHTESAMALIEQSSATEPWEQAVQVLLHGLGQRTDGDLAHRESFQILDATTALLLDNDTPTALFRTRAALTALDLTDTNSGDVANRLRALAVDSAVKDAYVARDVLTHPRATVTITRRQRETLTTVCRDAGLQAGHIPEPIRHDMMHSLATAEALMRRILSRHEIPRWRECQPSHRIRLSPS